jgi:hypothetical protein
MYLGALREASADVGPPVLLDDYIQLWRHVGVPDSVCRLCGRGIVSIGNGRWTHRGADGGRFVGCRAASYTSDGGWDDALPRHWKAAPPK